VLSLVAWEEILGHSDENVPNPAWIGKFIKWEKITLSFPNGDGSSF
jgi:hypothetical protein